MFKRLRISRVLWCGPLMALVSPFQPSLAQEAETGTEVVCSSGEQAERYIALLRGDEEEIVSQVNMEAVLSAGFVTRKGVRNMPQFIQFSVFENRRADGVNGHSRGANHGSMRPL